MLGSKIAERIRRAGPISFAEYQTLALYDEAGGFFAAGRGAGRSGRDFVTSPEVGTLFGALVARWIDAAWQRLGSPDPFVVVEVGAGRGRLAADVLRAGPDCAPALRYVLVERSQSLRRAQRDLLDLEPAGEVLGPFVRGVDPDDPDEPARGVGPIATSIDALPAIRVEGVVVANELLDNLPVHLVERTGGGWAEVRVGLDLEGAFAETLIPASDALGAEADEVTRGVTVPVGSRLPVPLALREWLEHVAGMLRSGEVILVDYGDEVSGLLARGPSGPRGWLRTYRAHGHGGAILDDPGSQDITCDVPLGYLRGAAERIGFVVSHETDQGAWLRASGIDELVVQGEATWRERAHLGDLEAVAGRSRAVEAAALTDPAGLGAHRVVVLQLVGH